MHMIWKYEIPIQKEFELELPKDGKILTVQSQDAYAITFIWVLFEMKHPQKTETRKFMLVGTGQQMMIKDTLLARYIGTFQQEEYVGHLFEMAPNPRFMERKDVES
jgi:hypothetical protein